MFTYWKWVSTPCKLVQTCLKIGNRQLKRGNNTHKNTKSQNTQSGKQKIKKT
jgi:hypothetical protein